MSEIIAFLEVLFLVVFSFFEKTTYCCRARRLSVRPAVRPSVEIISFRGISISNRPIDLKMSMNVRKGVASACSKGLVFRNSHCKLQMFCNLCCNSCKLRKISPYFLIIIVRVCQTYCALCTTRVDHSEQYNPREIRLLYTLITVVRYTMMNVCNN